jgi:uncharacterized protein (DUF736 family)
VEVDLEGEHRVSLVKLDDLSFPAPIYANLVEVEGARALAWSR